MVKEIAYIFIIALSLTIFGCDSALEEFEDQLAAASRLVEPPTLLTASPGDNSVKLTWSKIGEADNYTVYWQEGDNSDRGEIQVQGESFEHVEIKNYVIYHYSVSANARKKTSERSNSLSVTPLASVIQVSSGDSTFYAHHTCAIKTDNSLWCWGNNRLGQLGSGESGDRSIPTQESSKTYDWVNLDSGREITCAIKLNGSLYCWGARTAGIGSRSNINLNPTLVNDAKDWKSVSVGGHICAIKSNNTLYCWGENNFGQLGIDPNKYGIPKNGATRLTPTQEALATTDWDSVSAGIGHTCALRSLPNNDGKTLWCWGDNILSAIGVTTQSTYQPMPIQVGTDSNWVSISAAYRHTCGLKSDKTIECWGWNINGKAGQDPEQINVVESPTPIPGSDWLVLESGSSHNCAQESNGYVFCWGHNGYGQMGSNAPTNSHIPVQLGSINETDWASFSLGGAQTCTIRHNSQLYCWGSNSRGQIGNRIFAQKNRPTEIAINDTRWLSLSIGNSHTCAVKQTIPGSKTGALWCWGENSNGVLGFGNYSFANVPTPLNLGDNWSKVTSGENFQCAFENPYIGHKIYCWGNLFAGENSTLPIQEATGSSDWKYMDSGRFHSCAIKLDGTLYCWGVNGYGQLGHETTIVQSTPSKQSNDTDWAQISAGYNHTCGLKNNLTGKSLWCWGNNSLGQIGNGSSNLGANVTIPQQESRLDKDWTFVDTGDASTCAIKNTGTLWCWGWLGSVYYTSNIPTQMGIEADWLSISVGRDHFCGIRIDNSLWCWGTNSLGQLGDGTLVEKTFSDMIAVEETKSKDWSEVHSGRGNTCGLKLDGRIFCWGEGNGSNGNGSSWYIEPQLVLFP